MDMLNQADVLGLVVAVFIACAVEVVEAFTIVLAMGMTRGWGSAVGGALAGLATLSLLAAAVGMALRDLISVSLLQFAIGTLLLLFGLQWLRKAILRSAGQMSLHDEARIFADEVASARSAAAEKHLGVDWFGFVVSFKGVFLEGLEVVFIVITFGLGAAHRGVADAMLYATLGAVAAAALVTLGGLLVRRPLSMVPENLMKYAVGLLLSSFGMFWAIEGLGFFGAAHDSIDWPGGTAALGVIFLAWLAVSHATVLRLRANATTGPASLARTAPEAPRQGRPHPSVRLLLGLRDFVVGERWQIGAGVASLLVFGIALLEGDLIPAGFVAVLVGSTILALVPVLVYREAGARP